MPISLDEKSARAIARGRIAAFVEGTEERLAHWRVARPQKRLAWVRSVEVEFAHVFGDSALHIFSDKRSVYGLLLHPIKGGFEGWLAASIYIFRFRRAYPTGGTFAHFSAHAIARLLERLRVVDPIFAMKAESFVWALAALTSARDQKCYILPTKTGHFCGEWDRDQKQPVFATWLPDRKLGSREQSVLTELRLQERIGLSRKLTEAW